MGLKRLYADSNPAEFTWSISEVVSHVLWEYVSWFRLPDRPLDRNKLDPKILITLVCC